MQQKRTQSEEFLPRLYKRLALVDLLTQRLRQLTTQSPLFLIQRFAFREATRQKGPSGHIIVFFTLPTIPPGNQRHRWMRAVNLFIYYFPPVCCFANPSSLIPSSSDKRQSSDKRPFFANTIVFTHTIVFTDKRPLLHKHHLLHIYYRLHRHATVITHATFVIDAIFITHTILITHANT